MTRVSVAVMAHPRRAAVVPALVHRLGIGDDRVVWDNSNVEWDTGRRSLLALSPDATHHLVVQDDALVCSDLIAGLEQALPHTPAESIVSLYVGTRRPTVPLVQQAVNRANAEGAAWIVMDRLLWGVGIVVPAHTLTAMVEWCDRLPFPQYDRRINEYFEALGWPVWCTWPTLVDHRADTVSLLGHGNGRRSHNFLGESRSALDVDWSGPVVDVRKASTRASAPGSGRATVEYDRTGSPVDGGHRMGLHDPYNQRARVKAYYLRTGQIPASPQDTGSEPSPPVSNVDSSLAVVPDVGAAAGTASEPDGGTPAAETPAETVNGTAGGTPSRPRANASAATWRTYLIGLGYTEDDLTGLSRDELVAFADARTAGAAAG